MCVCIIVEYGYVDCGDVMERLMQMNPRYFEVEEYREEEYGEDGGDGLDANRTEIILNLIKKKIIADGKTSAH